jgi:ribosomal protein S4E
MPLLIVRRRLGMGRCSASWPLAVLVRQLSGAGSFRELQESIRKRGQIPVEGTTVRLIGYEPTFAVFTTAR